MKLGITILKYHSWNLCQISLQIMLLPIHIFSILVTITGDFEKRWPFEGVKRSKEKIWGRLSIRWAMAFPFFLSFNPFWPTFDVLFAHKNGSTPECTPNHQGEKIRKVLQHIICTHQQSVPLSVDQPVKTNHWDCFGYCANVNSLFMIQSTVKTTDYWGMTFH